MPDNPTDKKLTFVEQLAKEKECEKQFVINHHLQIYITSLYEGVHGDKYGDGYRAKFYPCMLCELETMLSEYHKYFKQNN